MAGTSFAPDHSNKLWRSTRPMRLRCITTKQKAHRQTVHPGQVIDQNQIRYAYLGPLAKRAQRAVNTHKNGYVVLLVSFSQKPTKMFFALQ